MNERKLNKILDAVRVEPPPAVPGDFDQRVMRQIRREPEPTAISFTDQLSALFPKVAFTAAAMIVLCVTGDFFLTAMDVPGVTEGLTQLADQWLLPEGGI